MWNSLKKIWFRFHTWVAVIVALLGLAYFISLALGFADSLPAGPNEGEILFKGYQFAAGRYQPYEDYSPRLQQMPLAYLLPGAVQNLFGLGMDTGRAYAVVVGVLTLIGLWLAVRRNADVWWAAAAVWVIILNPLYVQTFSQVATESLVSMLFAWMLYFGLGAERQDWELGVAGLLAGLAVIVQFNLLLVLLIFVLYVFWQFDKHAGWLVVASGILPLIVIHIVYWPGILQIWAKLVPEDSIAWLEPYRPPEIGSLLPADFSWWPVRAWMRNPQHLAWTGIRALGEAVRVNFVVFFGFLVTLFLWPWQRKNRPGGRSISKAFFNQHKQVVFLIVTFLTLFIVQLWAVNGRTCLFTCLPGGVMSFFIFGLVLVPAASVGWWEEMPFSKQILVVSIVFLVLLALEFNYRSDYEDFRNDVVRYTLDLKLPAWQNGKLAEGDKKAWEVLAEKTNFDQEPVRQFILTNQTAVTLIRWIKVLGYLILIIPLAYAISEKFMLGSENYGAFLLTFTLLVGFLLSGTHFYGGSAAVETCSDPVAAAYARVGKRLDSKLPVESQVYWGIGDDMLLLYLPEVEVFAPQLDGAGSYLEDDKADPDFLYRFGYWNSRLRDQWIEEADFILLENQAYTADWTERVETGQFQLVYTSRPESICRGIASEFVVLAPIP